MLTASLVCIDFLLMSNSKTDCLRCWCSNLVGSHKLTGLPQNCSFFQNKETSHPLGTRIRANPALDGQETSSYSGTIDLTGCCSHAQWPWGIMWPQLPTHQHQVTRMSDIMPLPFSFHSDYLQAIRSPLWYSDYPDFYLMPHLGIHLLWLGDWRLEPSKQFWLSWAPTPPLSVNTFLLRWPLYELRYF